MGKHDSRLPETDSFQFSTVVGLRDRWRGTTFCPACWAMGINEVKKCTVRKKNCVLGRVEQPRKEQTLLYRRDKLNEPTLGRTLYSLSPHLPQFQQLAWGHPSLISLVSTLKFCATCCIVPLRVTGDVNTTDGLYFYILDVIHLSFFLIFMDNLKTGPLPLRSSGYSDKISCILLYDSPFYFSMYFLKSFWSDVEKYARRTVQYSKYSKKACTCPSV